MHAEKAGTGNALLMAVAWPVAITLLCLPMAVRRFQRLSR